MAEQLIVLGNGFDLACGLKSSYSDFFKWLYFGWLAKGKKEYPQKESMTHNFWVQLFLGLREERKSV